MANKPDKEDTPHLIRSKDELVQEPSINLIQERRQPYDEVEAIKKQFNDLYQRLIRCNLKAEEKLEQHQGNDAKLQQWQGIKENIDQELIKLFDVYEELVSQEERLPPEFNFSQLDAKIKNDFEKPCKFNDNELSSTISSTIDNASEAMNAHSLCRDELNDIQDDLESIMRVSQKTRLPAQEKQANNFLVTVGILQNELYNIQTMILNGTIHESENRGRLYGGVSGFIVELLEQVEEFQENNKNRQTLPGLADVYSDRYAKLVEEIEDGSYESKEKLEEQAREITSAKDIPLDSEVVELSDEDREIAEILANIHSDVSSESTVSQDQNSGQANETEGDDLNPVTVMDYYLLLSEQIDYLDKQLTKELEKMPGEVVNSQLTEIRSSLDVIKSELREVSLEESGRADLKVIIGKFSEIFDTMFDLQQSIQKAEEKSSFLEQYPDFEEVVPDEEVLASTAFDADQRSNVEEGFAAENEQVRGDELIVASDQLEDVKQAQGDQQAPPVVEPMAVIIESPVPQSPVVPASTAAASLATKKDGDKVPVDTFAKRFTDEIAEIEQRISANDITQQDRAALVQQKTTLEHSLGLYEAACKAIDKKGMNEIDIISRQLNGRNNSPTTRRELEARLRTLRFDIYNKTPVGQERQEAARLALKAKYANTKNPSERPVAIAAGAKKAEDSTLRVQLAEATQASPVAASVAGAASPAPAPKDKGESEVRKADADDKTADPIAPQVAPRVEILARIAILNEQIVSLRAPLNDRLIEEGNTELADIEEKTNPLQAELESLVQRLGELNAADENSHVEIDGANELGQRESNGQAQVSAELNIEPQDRNKLSQVGNSPSMEEVKPGDKTANISKIESQINGVEETRASVQTHLKAFTFQLTIQQKQLAKWDRRIQSNPFYRFIRREYAEKKRSEYFNDVDQLADKVSKLNERIAQADKTIERLKSQLQEAKNGDQQNKQEQADDSSLSLSPIIDSPESTPTESRESDAKDDSPPPIPAFDISDDQLNETQIENNVDSASRAAFEMGAGQKPNAAFGTAFEEPDGQQQQGKVKVAVTDTQSDYQTTDQWEKNNRLPKAVAPHLDSTDPRNERALVEQYLQQHPDAERKVDTISPKYQGRIEVAAPKSATPSTAKPESSVSAKSVAPAAQAGPVVAPDTKPPVSPSSQPVKSPTPLNPTAAKFSKEIPQGVVKTGGLVNLTATKVASQNAQSATTRKPNSPSSLSASAPTTRAKLEPLSQGGSNAKANGVPNGAVGIVQAAQIGRVAQIASQFGGSVKSANDSDKDEKPTFKSGGGGS